MTEQQKTQIRKEGEVKKNENFDKLTGIFGQPQSKTEAKDGKVFEYHEKDQEDDEDDPDADVDYSHAHLEDFMKSLNQHNINKGFKKEQLATQDEESKDFGNSTLDPEKADNLISQFLQSVNGSSNQETIGNNNPLNPVRRAGSQIMSVNTDRIASNHTGATLTNSLAYSQTNGSVAGTQFNSVGLVSGVKSRQQEANEEIKIDEKLTEVRHQRNSTQELKLANDDDDEDLDRDEDFYIDVGSAVSEKSDKAKAKTQRYKQDQLAYSDGMKIMNQDLDPNYVNPSLLDQTNLFESQEVLLDPSNKESFKDYIETQMFLFHFNFDFEMDGMMLDENSEIPSFPFSEFKPTEDEVYYY